MFSTFLNLTAENDFRGNGRMIQYSATSAPLIVNTWTVPTTPRAVYGRVALGASTALSSNVSASFSVTRTLARRGGDDLTGSGGIKIAF